MTRPSAASERRLPSAGEPAREKPHRAGSSLNSGFWDCWREAREGGTSRRWGIRGGRGGGQRDKVVVGGPEPGHPAVAPALPAQAPTPDSLLTCCEVREPPNFLLFNEPRRRGCPEGVCSLKM